MTETVAAEDVVFELMGGRHIGAVRSIDRVCYSKPWSVATWRNELAEPNRTHLVARVADFIVGHAGSLAVLDEVHITTVAVHPDRQGAGVATRLVGRLIELAADSGARSATLEVRASDHRAQRLYRRFGFAPAGVRKAYYSNPADDGLVMWLHDLQGTAP